MKNRAKILILSHITQFSLATNYGGKVYGGLADMAFHNGNREVIPGDLVALKAAPSTKWYISWLVSKQWPEGYACEQYTLESIEDGELCDWHYVELVYYNRTQVESHPEWRWTDEQHAFNDRWKKVCFNERDAYIYLPTQAVFDGDAVTLGTRTRYSLDDFRATKRFTQWRKITKKQMLEFYDAAVLEAKSNWYARNRKNGKNT